MSFEDLKDMEIKDEDLTIVSGGNDIGMDDVPQNHKCPKCGDTQVAILENSGLHVMLECYSCGHKWNEDKHNKNTI